MTAVVAALWHPSPEGHDAASWLVGAAFVLALALAILAVVVTARARRRLVGGHPGIAPLAGARDMPAATTAKKAASVPGATRLPAVTVDG